MDIQTEPTLIETDDGVYWQMAGAAVNGRSVRIVFTILPACWVLDCGPDEWFETDLEDDER